MLAVLSVDLFLLTAQMSEEIVNAAVDVPRSIVTSIIINGFLGLAMLIAVLFCLGDPNAALEAQQTIGFPFIEVFIQGTGSIGGTTGMTCILIALSCSATIGFLATASRMIWSFSRDKGLPFSGILSQVRTQSTIPMYAIVVASIIPCLLTLINIGSTTVFNDVTSLALVGFYSIYFLSVALLLYRRITGSIRPRVAGAPYAPAALDKGSGEYELTWGPVCAWLARNGE